MKPEKSLINKKYLLQKFPGKGGWIYAAIPEIPQSKSTPFGWVKVKGSIDQVELKNYKLMPMGNGQLFLPVKASIRKIIGKKEGDWIHVILFADESPTEIPEELMECLKLEPRCLQSFNSLTDGQKKEYIDWIYEAKTESTRISRITLTLDKLSRNKRLRDNN